MTTVRSRVETHREQASTRGLVLCGGGSLAVEAATLLRDLDIHQREASVRVTDVVSPGTVRAADLAAICDGAFTVHPDIASVPDKASKQFLVCTGDPVIRHTIYRQLVGLNLTLARLIHPTAYIASSAVIGAGAIIYPGGASVRSRVGANVLTNAQVVIGHDARLDESAVLSPGARLCGHAACATASFLGTGATALRKVSLGAYSKISAGSVLTRSIGDGFLMHGNPAAGRQIFAFARDEAVR